MLLVDSHIVFDVFSIRGGVGVWIFKIVGLSILGSKLLEFTVHVGDIGWGSTILGKMTFTPAFMTISLKCPRGKCPRFKLVGSGPRGFSSYMFIPLVITLMRITLAGCDG